MNQQENLIDPIWDLDGNTATVIITAQYSIYAVVSVVCCFFFPKAILFLIAGAILFFIIAIINYKLYSTYVYQRKLFKLSFEENGLSVKQANDTGLLFVIPKQTDFLIPYTDIEQISLLSPTLYFKKVKYIYIHLKRSEQLKNPSKNFLPLSFYSINSISNLPGVWNNIVQIPAVKNENVDQFVNELLKFSKNASVVLENPDVILQETQNTKKRNIIILISLAVAIVYFICLYIYLYFNVW